MGQQGTLDDEARVRRVSELIAVSLLAAAASIVIVALAGHDEGSIGDGAPVVPIGVPVPLASTP